MRVLLAILVDFGFLIFTAYLAITMRGTMSGWFATIAAVAWTALIVDQIFFVKRS